MNIRIVNPPPPPPTYRSSTAIENFHDLKRLKTTTEKFKHI